MNGLDPLADAGASVEEIRELAGHADIRTTTIYTAVNDDRLQLAVSGADR
ncbi:MAG: tyrosine-type recombinase/integrase, partial [Solirubrobacterales bacterium]|nr:tyrosine-type recombinase/integrase [Solirubrobacterales bacterium]